MAATPISPRAQERQKARLAKLEEKWSVLFNQVKSISKKKTMWAIHYPRVRSYGVRVGIYWLFCMMNCLNFDEPSSEYDWVWMYKCRLYSTSNVLIKCTCVLCMIQKSALNSIISNIICNLWYINKEICVILYIIKEKISNANCNFINIYWHHSSNHDKHLEKLSVLYATWDVRTYSWNHFQPEGPYKSIKYYTNCNSNIDCFSFVFSENKSSHLQRRHVYWQPTPVLWRQEERIAV